MDRIKKQEEKKGKWTKRGQIDGLGKASTWKKEEKKWSENKWLQIYSKWSVIKFEAIVRMDALLLINAERRLYQRLPRFMCCV